MSSLMNLSGSIERESISLTIITGTIGRLYQDHMGSKVGSKVNSARKSMNSFLINKQSSLTAKISNGFTLKMKVHFQRNPYQIVLSTNQRPILKPQDLSYLLVYVHSITTHEGSYNKSGIISDQENCVFGLFL